jgi:hypothetical protein
MTSSEKMPVRVWVSERLLANPANAQVFPTKAPANEEGWLPRHEYIRASRYDELRRLAEAASNAHQACVDSIFDETEHGFAKLHGARLRAIEALRTFLSASKGD